MAQTESESQKSSQKLIPSIFKNEKFAKIILTKKNFANINTFFL